MKRYLSLQEKRNSFVSFLNEGRFKPRLWANAINYFVNQFEADPEDKKKVKKYLMTVLPKIKKVASGGETI